MKKIFMLLGLVFILSGCGKYNDKNLVKDISKKVNDSKGYHMTATLEIFRNEEKYSYDVDSSYKKGDFFKVDLVNQNNNHEQIILKNDEGVYVLTPSLNKSFKFQSDWPYNNSQIYLLQPILKDLQNDKNLKFKKLKNEYIFTSRVNYTNDKNLKNQKVYFDKDINLKRVEVFDTDNQVVMRLKVTKISKGNNFDDNYFNLDYYSDNSNDNNKTKINNKTQKTSTTNETLYPMYVPSDTYLNTQDVMATSSGNTTILTFTGNSPFTFVQSSVSDSINYVDGEPSFVLDSIGAVNDHSVSWVSNNKEYYLTSDVVSASELLMIADSLSVTEVGK